MLCGSTTFFVQDDTGSHSKIFAPKATSDRPEAATEVATYVPSKVSEKTATRTGEPTESTVLGNRSS